MSASPQLRSYMHWMVFHSLPENSRVAQGAFKDQLQQLLLAGFEGVQFAEPATKKQLSTCRELGLGTAASGRVNLPGDAAQIAEQVSGDGYECATLHVGWGLEDDAAVASLIESVLGAAERWHVPLYFETHRATICQDMWRTVNFVNTFPEMRFNGDFSHWYAGQEMVYGGFERKLAFIRPVLDRVRFIHGRIANPGCIQVAVQRDSKVAPLYVQHFQQLWEQSFRGFLESAQPDDFICFTPELLASDIYYARTFEGQEESDRWEQSLLLKEIAEECFRCAQSS